MRLLALLFGVALSLSAGRPLTVLAAASLTEAFRDLGQAFERRHPGTPVRLSLGASTTLRLQIEQGAPADLFASADTAQVEALVRAGLASEPRRLAGNRLALVVRAEGPLRRLQDLARPGLRLVMTPPTVPIGAYTDAFLARLGQQPGFGPGFAAGLKASVVSREPNVRALRAKVELGEADAAFVYASDAMDLPRGLRRLDLPEALQPDIALAIALVGRPRPEARAFLAFALGEEGQALLRRYGFR